MRLTRAPRVVQLCLHGTTANPQDNAKRIAMLPEIARAIYELPDWHPIDIVILPGGFFRMVRAFGASGFAERRTAVRQERFAGAVQAAVGLLEELSPGLRLVMGVLATPRDSTERTEQVSLAFSAKHLVLCRIERRPPRLDMSVYPYLPNASVALTSARTYMDLLTGVTS